MKLRWKGQLNGQQYVLGNNWEAWRNVENDGLVTVVFISENTKLQTVTTSKAESSKWVHRQIHFIECQKWAHCAQCDEAHRLQVVWGRNRIPVNYVLHPASYLLETEMETVVFRLREVADSLQPIDLGVVKYVEYDDEGWPLFLVGQKGKTYIMPLSPFASANRMQAAVRRYHVEGLKRAQRPN